MHTLVHNLADLLLTLLEYAMLFRAVMSWFPGARGNSFNVLLYEITEPLIAPVRSLMDRIQVLRGFPMDLSFMVTYMLLILVHGAL